jgi:hypothetical protein
VSVLAGVGGVGSAIAGLRSRERRDALRHAAKGPWRMIVRYLGRAAAAALLLPERVGQGLGIGMALSAIVLRRSA